MLKNTRKEAIAAGETQYFTGKPCKYGHTSYRYTASGACAECVAQAAADARDFMQKNRREFREQTVAKRTEALRPLVEARNAKADAVKRLTEVRVPINPQDLNTVFETATELCLATYPALERADVWPDATPIKGMPLYRVKVPVEHKQLMQDIATALWDAHSIDIHREHDRIVRQVEEMADREADEPPEGWK